MLALLLVLSQLQPTKVCDPNVSSKCVTVTDGGSGKVLLDVNVVQQPAGGAAVTSNQGTSRDGGTDWPVLATQNTSPWIVGDGAGPLTVDGTVTTTPPSNASTNVAQFGGTNVSTGTGAGGAGIPRVTISSDSSLAANQSVNVAQINGVTPLMGVGASGTGAQRTASLIHDGTTVAGVIVATTALKTDMSSVAGTATSTAAAGVQKVGIVGGTNTSLETTAGVLDVNQKNIGNVAISTGVGASGTGTQRVASLIHDGTTTAGVIAGTTALKTDVSSIAGTATVTAAAGVQKVGIVGNANAAVDAANNAAAPANVLQMGAQLQTQAQPTVGTAGQVGSVVAGLDHVLYVRQGGPVQWSCFMENVTANTQCRAATAAGIRAYVTSVNCANEAATVNKFDIVFGTGAVCATGITALTHKYQMGTNALTTSPFESTHTFLTPLVPTAANAICVRITTATAFGCTLTGYDAP